MKAKPLPRLFIAATLLCTAAFAHDEALAPEAAQAPQARVLGHVEFPTTTRSTPAQAAFVQGMLFLHLFEYEFAASGFQRAQALDPGFAMAYWGEAIVHNHPIWDQQDLDKARAVLNGFAPTAATRSAKTSSPKEKDYLAGLEILYGEGPKAGRDRSYMRHMEQMAARYPEDPEVRLFYALSIMGTFAGVRDIPAYMESAALSQSVFYANRDHPGAAHYLIHAVDDPVHAPLGLEAARALYRIAPDAGHSLHMTSHIFLALGMWDDVVAANTNAVRVHDEMSRERGEKPSHVGHYNFWLLYALLQQGRKDDAKKLLSAAYAETSADGKAPTDPLILDPDNSPLGSMVQMWARYMLETGGTDVEVGAWQFNTGEAFDPRLTRLYVSGLLSRRPAEIETDLADFRALKTELRKRVMTLPRHAPTDLLYLDRLEVIDFELQASLARARGDKESALEFAREASRLEGVMPWSFGPPFVDYPAAQMLGELALESGRRDEAIAAFTEQLARSRRKTAVVQGLERAERLAGN